MLVAPHPHGPKLSQFHAVFFGNFGKIAPPPPMGNPESVPAAIWYWYWYQRRPIIIINFPGNSIVLADPRQGLGTRVHFFKFCSFGGINSQSKKAFH